MFVIDDIFQGKWAFLLLVTPIIYAVVGVFHSWIVGKLFARIARNKFVGIFFFVVYAIVALVSCTHMSELISAGDKLDEEYGIILVIFGMALSGAFFFFDALWADADDWETYVEEESEEDFDVMIALAAIIVGVASLILHPIAVAVGLLAFCIFRAIGQRN